MAKDTITVVATGNQNTVFETPSMVSVVTNDTPWSQNAVTSAGMLKGVAGLSQTGAGRTNGQTFNLRGYDKSGVLVLVDGIRQLSDMAKSSGTYLDPALVKRIEVVRGPNSSLYGSGGLGGVVDFRTADAADFLPPGETNGLSLWGNIASGDHSTGSGLTWFGKTGKTDALLSVIMRKRGNIYQSDGERAPNKEKPAALFAKGSVGITDSNKAGASLRLYRNNTTEPGNPTQTHGDSGLRDRKTVQNDVQFWYQYAPVDNSLINVKSTLYLSDITIKTNGHNKTAEWRNNRTQKIYVGGRDYINEIDAKNQTLLRTIPLKDPRPQITSVQNLAVDSASDRAFVVVFDHDDRSGTKDGLYIFDLRDGKQLGYVHTGAGANAVKYNPKYNELYVTNFTSGTISVVDATKYSITREFNMPVYPNQMVLSDDMDTLYIGIKEGFNRDWDPDVFVEGAKERILSIDLKKS
ncbi:TonB-dependent receptor plug domain-containing protein [Escherichia coli]|nr:TonB-dependent receptor plug domain-containing protein [Escherichia coli]